ncbi:MAG: hypothetical protein Kow0099_23460 [Candidatus Abyssubacteria bacterium]
MKILERKPASYDAGIARYSAGDFQRVRDEMLALVQPGYHILDVGCGPGTFAVECAKRGAFVEAVDVNPQMLFVADLAAKEAGVQERVRWQHASATKIDAQPGTFDIVVFSLCLSEMREVEQSAALNCAWEFLKPGGTLVVCDEVVPETLPGRTWYHLRRIPLLGITYLLTRTKTSPVQKMETKLEASGFEPRHERTYEHDSLKLIVSDRNGEWSAPAPLSPDRLPRWRELLGVIFSYLTLPFKSVPIKPGLYRFGNPGRRAPVFVSANYLLTFFLVRRHLRALDCYLLVIDTRGINVWCAASEGTFSAEEVRIGLRAARAEDIVETRTLILPKLSSSGVRYRDVKALTGWQAVFGPVYARDIPEYIGNGQVNSERMKRVRFGFAERLWTAPPFALFVAFWFVLPLLLFHNLYSLMIPGIAFAAGIAFPLAFPLLPTDRFFKKSLVLGFFGAGLSSIHLLAAGASARSIVLRGLVIVGMTLFVGMDYSGMSAVSNYSKIKEEYYVAAPLLALIVIAGLAVRFLWR